MSDVAVSMEQRRANRRPFPMWSEVLEVFLSLGYRKVVAPSRLPGVKGGA